MRGRRRRRADLLGGRELDFDIFPLPEGTFSAVSAGQSLLCALDTDGAIACWGEEEDGATTGAPTGGAAAVSASVHACSLDTDGALSCWGGDDYGQVSGAPAGQFTSVSAGRAHTCAIDAAGAISCWGWDDEGQVSGAP